MLKVNVVFFINCEYKLEIICFPGIFRFIVVETILKSHLNKYLISDFCKTTLEFVIFYRILINTYVIPQRFSFLIVLH